MKIKKYFELKKQVENLRSAAQKLNLDGRKKVVKEFCNQQNNLRKLTIDLQNKFLLLPKKVIESNINKQITLAKILNKNISINKNKTSIYLGKLRISNHWHNSNCGKFQTNEYFNTDFMAGKANSKIETAKNLSYKKNYLINKRLVLNFLSEYGK